MILSQTDISQAGIEIYEVFRDRIIGLFSGKNMNLIDEFFSDVQSMFSDYAVPCNNNLMTIRDHLKIVEEYYSYHDFKLADRMIVDDLLYILYADRVSLIKLLSERVLDNITTPLLLDPINVVYVGLEDSSASTYHAFFKGRGENTSVSARRIGKSDIAGIRKELESIVRAFVNPSCVIDVTGAEPLLTAAAMQIAMDNANIGVVCSDTTKQRIINLQNFIEAPIYREEHSLSTKEAYALFGAQERVDISKDSSYLLDLIDVIPKAWNLYNHIERRAFSGICQLFTFFKQNSAAITWRYPVTDIDRENWEKSLSWDFSWVPLEHEFGERFVQTTCLRTVLQALEQKRLIRELSFKTIKDGLVSVTLLIQNAFCGTLKKFFNEIKDERYEVVSYETFDNKYKIVMNTVGIQARNSKFFKGFISKNMKLWDGDKPCEYDLDMEIYQWLQKLQEFGIICKLRRTDKYKDNKLTGAEIQFEFVGASNNTMRAIFDKTGTILELHAWHEAMQQRCFRDIRPNFGFSWGEGTVSNELDLILTHKGCLKTAVISCKTSAIKLEHVYEVLYLTEKFSLQSKACIIYTQNRYATEEAKDGFDEQRNKIPLPEAKRNRIKAMGVELIILEELIDQTLGEALEKLFE